MLSVKCVKSQLVDRARSTCPSLELRPFILERSRAVQSRRLLAQALPALVLFVFAGTHTRVLGVHYFTENLNTVVLSNLPPGFNTVVGNCGLFGESGKC
jgi:hypothetical protein